jgi:hypothetical protein
LIQEDLNERTLCELCCRFLAHSPYCAHVKKELGKVRDMLGQPGASARAARIITDILRQPEAVVVSRPGPG